MTSISPVTTIISAILLVVVLIIAFNLRKKIKRNERGNEFFPWERDSAQGSEVAGMYTDEEYDKLTGDEEDADDGYFDDGEYEEDDEYEEGDEYDEDHESEGDEDDDDDDK